jgi:endonuclease YncB( thermonuclease family)
MTSLQKGHLLVALLLCWTVSGTLVRTVDGDTFDANLQIWTNLYAVERIRILGVNTPETNQPGFWAAKAYTDNWAKDLPFLVEACKRDNFGRLLGKVSRNGEVLADKLIETGNGVVYKK